MPSAVTDNSPPCIYGFMLLPSPSDVEDSRVCWCDAIACKSRLLPQPFGPSRTCPPLDGGCMERSIGVSGILRLSVFDVLGYCNLTCRNSINGGGGVVGTSSTYTLELFNLHIVVARCCIAPDHVGCSIDRRYTRVLVPGFSAIVPRQIGTVMTFVVNLFVDYFLF